MIFLPHVTDNSISVWQNLLGSWMNNQQTSSIFRFLITLYSILLPFSLRAISANCFNDIVEHKLLIFSINRKTFARHTFAPDFPSFLLFSRLFFRDLIFSNTSHSSLVLKACNEISTKVKENFKKLLIEGGE